jgi:hypothetical protein
MLEVKHRALSMLDKCSTIELHPQPLSINFRQLNIYLTLLFLLRLMNLIHMKTYLDSKSGSFVSKSRRTAQQKIHINLAYHQLFTLLNITEDT